MARLSFLEEIGVLTPTLPFPVGVVVVGGGTHVLFCGWWWWGWYCEWGWATAVPE